MGRREKTSVPCAYCGGSVHLRASKPEKPKDMCTFCYRRRKQGAFMRKMRKVRPLLTIVDLQGMGPEKFGRAVTGLIRGEVKMVSIGLDPMEVSGGE